MAKLLFKQGSFRILSDDVGALGPGEMNELIKLAGATCYQTRETSKKTPEEFIQMLQKRHHHAMLEHSWFTLMVAIPSSYSMPRDYYGPRSLIEAAEKFYRSNGLFRITAGDDAAALFISGNSRMFNEAYQRTRDPLVGTCLKKLHGENPVLFPKPETINDFETYRHVEVVINPKLAWADEIFDHRAMSVEFNNHSRGFTHELVRHRIAAFAQESTRYVDYARGDVDLGAFQVRFVLPYNDKFDFSLPQEFEVDGVKYSFTPQQFTDLIEGWYRTLRKAGLKPEEARQWLPIGLKSQIVMTANLREWRHFFYLRANAPAHPEIRFTAVNLLKEVQQRIPGIFDDFEFKTKEDGSEYAVYTGKDPLV